jgi:hypothetical protein
VEGVPDLQDGGRSRRGQEVRYRYRWRRFQLYRTEEDLGEDKRSGTGTGGGGSSSPGRRKI